VLEAPTDTRIAYGLAFEAARLDGLAALRDRDGVEAEVPPYLRAGTYLEPFALRALGIVREDEALVDRALEHEPNPEVHRGVTPLLARRVRAALDDAGHERVRIVVSGGFDAAKITRFEAEGTPVDAYGVGSSLLRGPNDFTADVVRVDGRAVAKVGREERPNPRLALVD
jgi:hypothetical protein